MTQYDPIACFYDADHANYLEDLSFYRELARRTGGMVLEAMCGSGRLLVPLAKAGLRITGTDESQAMLDLAEQRLRRDGGLERATLIQADVRETATGGPYGLAIVALNSFMHLTTVEDQIAALRALWRSLRPGGLLALDLFNPNPRLIAEYDNQLVFDHAFELPNGSYVQKFVAQQVDAAAQINTVTFIYDETTSQQLLRRHTVHFQMRWIYRYELEHLLVRAGFVLEQLYGSYELDQYRSDSDILLAVARKIE